MIEAAKNGQIAIVKFCAENGANDFNEPMAWAARSSHMDIVRFCIEKG